MTPSNILRYAWPLAVAAALGMVASAVAWSSVDVEYEARGALWIEGAAATADRSPRADARLAAAQASNVWAELLRSHRVLDEVVEEHGLQVEAPTDAREALSRHLRVAVDRSGSFMTVSLRGADPQRTRAILQSVLDRQVHVAADLKARKHEQTLQILEEQLQEVEDRLLEAERALETVRVAAAMESPSDKPLIGAEERRIRRGIRSLEFLYKEVRSRVEQARLERASAIPDIRILDEATVSERPVDDVRLPLAAALLFGFLGVGSAATLALAHRRSAMAGLADTRRGRPRTLRNDGDVLPLVVVVGGAVLALLLTLALLAG